MPQLGQFVSSVIVGVGTGVVVGGFRESDSITLSEELCDCESVIVSDFPGWVTVTLCVRVKVTSFVGVTSSDKVAVVVTEDEIVIVLEPYENVSSSEFVFVGLCFVRVIDVVTVSVGELKVLDSDMKRLADLKVAVISPDAV